MKKLLFSTLALFTALSLNAQLKPQKLVARKSRLILAEIRTQTYFTFSKLIGKTVQALSLRKTIRVFSLLMISHSAKLRKSKI